MDPDREDAADAMTLFFLDEREDAADAAADDILAISILTTLVLSSSSEVNNCESLL